MTCSLILQFSSEDVVAVRVKNVRREGDSFVFVSAYMALEEPALPVIPKELLSFSDRDEIPTVIGTDANAHHTVWGSSNVNIRGMDLLMYCAGANLQICNVGNKTTFRTRKREEVLDLTLINRNVENCISNWQRWVVSRYLYRRYVSRDTFVSISVSIKHVFVNRRYKYLDTVFEHDQSYQVLTACSFTVSEECEMKLTFLIDSKRRTVREFLLPPAYLQLFRSAIEGR